MTAAAKPMSITPKGYCYVKSQQMNDKLTFAEFDVEWDHFQTWIADRVRKGRIKTGAVDYPQIWDLWLEYREGRK